MRSMRRLYLIAVLLIASVVMITSSTMAFYTSSTSMTANLVTAGYVLLVNDSTAETQTLSDMTIAPGESFTRDVRINTAGLDAPSTLTVTLTVHASGALPEGFAVSLDGTQVSGSTLSATKTVENAQDQVVTMQVAVSWAQIAGTDYSLYRDLSITYDVVVAAAQTGG